MWEAFVEIIRATIVSAAQACGGSLGGGIVAVSLAIRMGLMPLTIRIARRSLAQQRRLAELRPQFERLRKRWARDPERLFRETQALNAKHGIRLLDPRSLVSSLIQFPLLAGMFSAVRTGLATKVRFLWIGDLARPDSLLIALVVAMTAGAAATVPTATNQAGVVSFFAVVAAIGTLVFLASTSSALALSVGAGSAVSMVQNTIVRRTSSQK